MDIQSQELLSTFDNITLKSYVCLPKNASDTNPAPAILVAPEWWGLSEFPRQVAKRLAQAGFAAVVMDIYGEGKLTADAAQAGEWMKQMLDNPELMLQRCRLILKDFSDIKSVDGDRLGAIGFCFGGKIALDMARFGLPLKAVATFHGNPTPYKKADHNFTAKVLIAHGEGDSMVSMTAINELKNELDNANVDYTLDIYQGAKHGFSNPNADKRGKDNDLDLGYDEAAARTSWDKMIAFMEQTLNDKN